MKRGDDGYMRVVAGMPDPANRLPPSARRRLTQEERRALVIRLRGQGWSYRRISGELNISYATVSRWLDDPDAVVSPLPLLPAGPGPCPSAAPRPAAPRPATMPPSAPEAGAPPPVLDHLLAQNRVLLRRVEQLVAADAARRQAMEGLERRLIATMEEQNRKLGDRLLEAVKTMLRKFLPG